jgi:hypothetical protein
MNMNARPGISRREKVRLVDAGSTDIDQVQMRAITILGAFELIGSLVEAAMEKERLAPQIDHNQEMFLNNIQLICSTFADLTCVMLDGLNRATSVR